MRRTRSASSLVLWSTRVLVRGRSPAAGNGRASSRPLISDSTDAAQTEGVSTSSPAPEAPVPENHCPIDRGHSTIGGKENPDGSTYRDRDQQSARDSGYTGAEASRSAHRCCRRRLFGLQLLDGFRE